MFNWLLLVAAIILVSGFETIAYRLLAKGERGENASALFMLIGAAVLLPFVHGWPGISWVWLIAAAGTAFYVISNVFFFKSYSRGQVSLLKPLGNMEPLIVLVLSIVLLSESLTVQKIAGTVLIVLGMSYLKETGNITKGLRALFHDRTVQLFTLSAIAFSFARITDKLAVSYFDILSYGFLQFAAPAVIILALIAVRGDLGNFANFVGRRWKPGLAAGVLCGFRYVLYLTLISQVELSTAFPLISLSVIWAMLLAALLLHERITGRLPGALLMIAGAILLTV